MGRHRKSISKVAWRRLDSVPVGRDSGQIPAGGVHRLARPVRMIRPGSRWRSIGPAPVECTMATGFRPIWIMKGLHALTAASQGSLRERSRIVSLTQRVYVHRMMAKSHVIVGLAAWVAAAPLLHLSPVDPI